MDEDKGVREMKRVGKDKKEINKWLGEGEVEDQEGKKGGGGWEKERSCIRTQEGGRG